MFPCISDWRSNLSSQSAMHLCKNPIDVKSVPSNTRRWEGEDSLPIFHVGNRYGELQRLISVSSEKQTASFQWYKSDTGPQTDRIIKNKCSKKQPSINPSSSLPGQVKTVNSCVSTDPQLNVLSLEHSLEAKKDTSSCTDGYRAASSFSPSVSAQRRDCHHRLHTVPAACGSARCAAHGAVRGEAPLQPSSSPVHLSEL